MLNTKMRVEKRLLLKVHSACFKGCWCHPLSLISTNPDDRKAILLDVRLLYTFPPQLRSPRSNFKIIVAFTLNYPEYVFP
jgi:hypothetical protein